MKLLYEGKAKKFFFDEENKIYIQEFKDSLTAFNGEKYAEKEGKGKLNCQISTTLFKYLENNGIKTHFIKEGDSPNKMIVEYLDIIPLEVVMRNIAAGSIVKRLGLEKGKLFESPLFELYLKNDELGDPMINRWHAFSLGLATDKEIDSMVELAFKINKLLFDFFKKRGYNLVDIKFEFGRKNGELILGDEISPDTFRLWDNEGKNYDKDVFRKDTGDVIQTYEKVLEIVTQ